MNTPAPAPAVVWPDETVERAVDAYALAIGAHIPLLGNTRRRWILAIKKALTAADVVPRAEYAELEQIILGNCEVQRSLAKRAERAESRIAELEGELVLAREDAERRAFVVKSNFIVRPMKDTGLFMVLDQEGYPVTGNEYETENAAIDDAIDRARGEK